MISTTVARRSPHAWMRIAFAMFAVGWGANQFSPMLIVYRHELRLTAGEVAGLFLVYALTLIPGLLIGGPASDRFGRRPVVWPFVALSPLATLLLVLGPRSLAVIAVGRALAGLCSGVVFGAATAWVQEVSPDEGLSVRRSALALTAGLMTVVSFAAGVAVQPFARRLHDMLAGVVAGLVCAAAGCAVGIAAVASADRVLAGVAAVFLGLAYGLCLVSGLRQAEHMAGPDERGAVIACYYAVAYLGFAVPYLAAGLGALASKSGAFVALTAIIAALALWTAGYTASLRRSSGRPEGDVIVRWSRLNRDSVSR